MVSARGKSGNRGRPRPRHLFHCPDPHLRYAGCDPSTPFGEGFMKTCCLTVAVRETGQPERARRHPAWEEV